MFKVGLTGGIGSGKSTVAECFAKLGIPVIDADIIARQLVAPGSGALNVIAEQFGVDILTPDGALNRDRMRELIYCDPQKKTQLEAILHPKVFAQITQQIQELQAPYVILAIPLLFETDMQHFVDRCLVIDCPVEAQIARVLHRDGLSRERILSIIAAQIPRQQRRQRADDIIENNGNISLLADQVKKLHNSYLSKNFSENNS